MFMTYLEKSDFVFKSEEMVKLMRRVGVMKSLSADFIYLSGAMAGVVQFVSISGT